jgi:hypothetical protein
MDDWNTGNGNGNDDYNAAMHQRTEELYRIPNAVSDDQGIIELPGVVLTDLVSSPSNPAGFSTAGPNCWQSKKPRKTWNRSSA